MVSNHIVIRFIRFVSRFTVHLCNAIYFFTTFSTPCKRFTKILYFAFWDLNKALLANLQFGACTILGPTISLQHYFFFQACFPYCNNPSYVCMFCPFLFLINLWETKISALCVYSVLPLSNFGQCYRSTSGDENFVESKGFFDQVYLAQVVTHPTSRFFNVPFYWWKDGLLIWITFCSQADATFASKEYYIAASFYAKVTCSLILLFLSLDNYILIFV